MRLDATAAAASRDRVANRKRNAAENWSRRGLIVDRGEEDEELMGMSVQLQLAELATLALS